MGPWWFRHVEKPALRIDCGKAAVSDYIDDDALPASSSTTIDALTGTTAGTMAGPRPKRQKQLALPYYDSDAGSRYPAPKQDLSERNGHCYTKTRDGSEICLNYTQGRRMQSVGNNRCFHNPSLAHQCSICLKCGHTGAARWLNPVNMKKMERLEGRPGLGWESW